MPAGLAEALAAAPRQVLRGRFDYLVELDSESTVRALKPDLTRLAAIETRGVMVTAPADAAGADFVLRFFAPRCGVPEDPVTGSACCTLAPFWAARLGRERLVGRQLSRRGGVMRVALAGSRVRLSGQAVTVLKGALDA
jgi:predicted PhzF superfamily epimerase YddE/YHI9